MTSPESSIGMTDDVDQWVNAHLNDIVAAMKRASLTRAFEDIIAYEDLSESFNPGNRAFSEMPICDHFWSHLDLPPGFEIIPWSLGRVNIIGQTTRMILYSPNHTYGLRSSDGVILCLTPGQFIAFSRTDLFAGERLQILKNKAPDLISLYPDDQNKLGIATLVGSKEEIAKRLNLDYTTVC